MGPLIGVLGPVVVAEPGGGYVPVTGRASRVLLARLVVGPAAVSVDELADALWGEAVPPSVAVTLKSHLSRLRALLRVAAGYDPIAAYPGAYRLTVPSADSDAGAFEAALVRARALPAVEAVPALRKALGLWRGPAFGDLRYEKFAAGEAARLEEVRLVALEACIDAELRSGRAPETIPELASLTEQHPLRPGLVGLRMRALHHAGRQRDALVAYDRHRVALVEQAGLEPVPELNALLGAILAGRPPPSAAPPAIRYAPTSAGTHVGYLRRGNGPPWLLAMGCDAHISVTHLDEEPVTAAVERRLAASAGLVRLDRPGIGLSDPLPQQRAPTSEEWACAGLAVADHAGMDHFAVLGTGWSTPAAIALAVSQPERVHALIVFNGFARFVRAPDYPIGIPPGLVERFRQSVLDTSQDAMPADLDDVILHAPSRADDLQFRSWWRRAGQQSAPPAVSSAHFALLFDADVRDRLSRVTQPTLILHRRLNRYVRADHARYLAEHIPNSTIREFDGADQLLASGDPEPLLEAIESFVSGATSPPSGTAGDGKDTTVLQPSGTPCWPVWSQAP